MDGPARPTPADLVTLGRTLLVVGVAARSARGPGGLRRHSWWLPAAGSLAWALDGVDGYVARRTGTAGERGARWDDAADAALAGVLALVVARQAPWALVGGALYPAFRLGQRVRPAWRHPLPRGRRGKVVGGVLTGTLLACTVPRMPVAAVRAASGGAVALTAWSFGVDVAWLERRSRNGPGTRAQAGAGVEPGGQPAALGNASR